MTSQLYLIKSETEKVQIASVAVISGGKILMGKRKDSGKYTLPGGHMDKGETPLSGAQRELFEETGIGLIPSKFKSLGSKDVLSYPQNKPIRVHAFKVFYNGPTTMMNDPDDEVYRWQWFDMKNMPDKVMENLHVKGRNVVFEKLGIKEKIRKSYIVKSDKMVVSKKDMINEHKNLVHVLRSPSKKDDIKEAKKQEKEIEEYSKSFKYVIDLVKARPHKYLRKYKRGDKWIYIYHEGENRPKKLDDEAVGALHTLADRDMKGARGLLDSAEEIHKDKLRALLELSKRGHEDSKKHLESLGIDHEEEYKEQLKAEHPLRKDMDSETKQKVVNAFISASDETFGYLGGHVGTDMARRLVEKFGGIQEGKDKLAEISRNSRSVHEAIEKLKSVMDEIDEAHSEFFLPNGNFNSSNTSAKQAKGYGNLGYNTFIKGLESNGVLPEGYEEATSRDGDIPNPKDVEEMVAKRRAEAEEERLRKEEEARVAAEREAAEARERMEREHGELMGEYGESSEDMISYFGTTRSDEYRINLMKGIKKIFGKDFDFKDFEETLNTKRNGEINEKVKIKISEKFMKNLVEAGVDPSPRGRVNVRFTFNDISTGREITYASRYIEKNSDGSITWHNSVFNRADNSDLKKYAGMANGLYGGVFRFMRKVTANYTGNAKKNCLIEIGSAANSGFRDGFKGGLVWAKHGFDFSDAGTANDWKRKFTNSLDRYSRNSTIDQSHLDELKEKINGFKYPYEFANTGYMVSRDEALRLLDRTDFDFDFNSIFEAKTYVDIGSLIIVDREIEWSPKAYIHRDDERSTYTRNTQEQVYGVSEATPQGTTRLSSGLSSRTESAAGDALSSHERAVIPFIERIWPPSGSRGSITVNARRLRTISTWPKEQVQAFLRKAPLTSAGKARVREILRGM